MFEHFTTPEELFIFKLGSTLTMERDSLAMLGELASATRRPELKELFEDHAAETRQQIANLEKCFELLGEEIKEFPSPTTKGLAKESKASIAKTDARIVDAVLLAGGLETEHYEIAVYETLVNHADARGAMEVKTLLQQNLEQEIAASEKIKEAAKRIAREGIAVDSENGA